MEPFRGACDKGWEKNPDTAKCLAAFFLSYGSLCPELARQAAELILESPLWSGPFSGILTGRVPEPEQMADSREEERYFRNLWEGERL